MTDTVVITATEDDVRACFRLLLGREPTDNEWPGHSLLAGSPLEDLVRGYLSSLEFQQRGLLSQTDALTAVDIDGVLVYVYDDDMGPSALIKQGGYEQHVTALIRRELVPGAVFLDLGANVGYYTMLSASIVGPSGWVVAIEPSPRNVRAVLAGAAANGFTCVDVRMVAAASSWRPLSFGTAGTNGMTGAMGDPVTTSTIVQGAPMSSVLADCRPVDLVKIDVEGAEFDALQGYLELLTRDRPSIVAEFGPPGLEAVSGVSGEDLLRLVLDVGYEVSVIEVDGSLAGATRAPADIMRTFQGVAQDHIDIFFRPLP